MANTFNHPKYGLIVNPSYRAIEICYADFNTQPDPDDYISIEEYQKNNYRIVDELKKISKSNLVLFIRKFLDLSDQQRVNDSWQDCFGRYFGSFSNTMTTYHKLSIDETIYFILQCYNHGCLKEPGFFALLPGKYYGAEPLDQKNLEDALDAGDSPR